MQGQQLVFGGPGGGVQPGAMVAIAGSVGHAQRNNPKTLVAWWRKESTSHPLTGATTMNTYKR